MSAGALHIKFADVPCPKCGASVTRPCQADTGYNYDFRYTHIARRWAWKRYNQARRPTNGMDQRPHL